MSLPKSGPLDRIDVPLQKSVVRAALARVAVLCNERIPGSVSPFGGQGRLRMLAVQHGRFESISSTLLTRKVLN